MQPPNANQCNKGELIDMFHDKVILITGGTGSFGKKCTEIILKRYKPKKLIIFSRDELKQFEMSQIFSDQKYPCMRYLLVMSGIRKGFTWLLRG